MTKKHPKALAAKMAEEHKKMIEYGRDTISAISQWDHDCHAIADVCAEYGPAFDRDRFIAACNA